MSTGATKEEVMSGPDERTRRFGLDLLGQISRNYRDARLEYIPVAAPGRLRSGGLNPASQSPRSSEIEAELTCQNRERTCPSGAAGAQGD
jgi:hypothetical protein